MLCRQAVKVSFFLSFTLCGCTDRFTAPMFINGRRVGGSSINEIPTDRQHSSLITTFPPRSLLQPPEHLRTSATPPPPQHRLQLCFQFPASYVHPPHTHTPHITTTAAACSEPPQPSLSHLLPARRRTEGGQRLTW